MKNLPTLLALCRTTCGNRQCFVRCRGGHQEPVLLRRFPDPKIRLRCDQGEHETETGRPRAACYGQERCRKRPLSGCLQEALSDPKMTWVSGGASP